MTKVYAGITLFLSLCIIGKDTYKKYDNLSMSQISNMIVQVAPANGKIKEVILTKDRNFAEIWVFVKLINSSRPYVDDRDTTHPIYICLYLSNGDKIEVWGGSEDFQQVHEVGNRYIFKSASLSLYFKFLYIRYKP